MNKDRNNAMKFARHLNGLWINEQQNRAKVIFSTCKRIGILVSTYKYSKVDWGLDIDF